MGSFSEFLTVVIQIFYFGIGITEILMNRFIILYRFAQFFNNGKTTQDKDSMIVIWLNVQLSLPDWKTSKFVRGFMAFHE